MNFIKRFFESKMLRLALFIFMFFFIFKIIDHILIFFNINQEMGYIYFMWFTVLFLLFVLLPIDRSYFKIFNKVPPATSKSNYRGDDGGEPSRETSVGSSEVAGRNLDTNFFNIQRHSKSNNVMGNIDYDSQFLLENEYSMNNRRLGTVNESPNYDSDGTDEQSLKRNIRIKDRSESMRSP